ncbi:methyltransferase domain-containing protein [bacterium]|nr:methyltransferase domain-containing protein [bacterium]
MAEKFQKIDDEGYLVSDEGHRQTDENFGREFLSSIYVTEKSALKSNYKNLDLFVEAFDEPYIVRHVDHLNEKLVGHLPYGLQVELLPQSFCIDEWDRFHGLTTKQVPFVFSRQAQMEFFDLLDSFEDDSITLNGVTYSTPEYFVDKSEVNGDHFWTEIYQTEDPDWDLKEPATPLHSILPQLKLSKQRVLVLGCGKGHDAAFLAQKGHLVTAVDFSPEAIRGAKENYGNIQNIQWVQGDAFQLSKELGPFDMIFEHTCYCAISPTRRKELIKVWRDQLVSGGHLLGIFFTMSRRIGPPFGGSEWELTQRLKSHFQNRYWTRWRNSIPGRQGKELIVYAQKK